MRRAAVISPIRASMMAPGPLAGTFMKFSPSRHGNIPSESSSPSVIFRCNDANALGGFIFFTSPTRPKARASQALSSKYLFLVSCVRFRTRIPRVVSRMRWRRTLVFFLSAASTRQSR